jgi:hypothetical protein
MVLSESATQMELQDIEYYDPAVPADSYKDRNIPTDVSLTMALVMWGQIYPNPSAADDKEIVIATWTGSGRIYDIIRGAESSIPNVHIYGDNVALLWTADMNWEVCIFRTMLKDTVGSIGYTWDTDGDGEMEIEPLQPDDEIFIGQLDGLEYNKVLVCGGPSAAPYWDFPWNVGASQP